MAVYYRYVATNKAETVPAWSTVWPGLNGCPNRTLSLTSTPIEQPPSPGSPQIYQSADYDDFYKAPFTQGCNFTKGLPPYYMTDYYICHKKRVESLTTTHMATTPVNVFYQFGNVSKIAGNCTPVETKRSSTGPQYSTYDERLGPNAYSTYPVHCRSILSDRNVLSLIGDMRNELIADASQAYDALTDICQLGDIPRSIVQVTKDISDVLGMLRGRFPKSVLSRAYSMRPLDLLRHAEKLMRRLGETWMNYRYGIMPLVYSYRDIIKAMNRGQNIKTHKLRTIEPEATGETMPPDTSMYLVSDVVGSIVIRGEVFQHFTSSEIARLSGIGINPLTTLWELLPYSFVVDWFVNVGNYIAATFSTSWAQTKYACLSRRDNYLTTTYVHLPQRDQTKTVVNKLPTNWWGAAPPATPNVIIKNPSEDQILIQERVDLYRRWAIPITSVAPTLNPYLNWKRLIDGAYLLLTNLGGALRSLR